MKRGHASQQFVSIALTALGDGGGAATTTRHPYQIWKIKPSVKFFLKKLACRAVALGTV